MLDLSKSIIIIIIIIIKLNFYCFDVANIERIW